MKNKNGNKATATVKKMQRSLKTMRRSQRCESSVVIAQIRNNSSDQCPCWRSASAIGFQRINGFGFGYPSIFITIPSQI